MSRSHRPAVAFLAAFALVMVAACTGGTSAVGGATATPVPTDASSLLRTAVQSSLTVKSFHVTVDVSGTVKKEALQATGMAGSVAGDITLDGTKLEGDVDVANQALDVKFNVPAIPLAGGQPLNGEVIAKDRTFYYKVSALGDKFVKVDMNALPGGAMPTPGPSAMAGWQDALNKLEAKLASNGVTATLVGTDSVNGQDANHVVVNVPIDKINAAIAAHAGASPTMTVDTASVDLWIYKTDNRVAKAELKASSSTAGNFDVVATFSNYDAPVTVTAPPDSEVQPTS